MDESIRFPESHIPEVVRIIRRGIKGEKVSIITKKLERQCQELEEYYDRKMRDDDDDGGEEPPLFFTER